MRPLATGSVATCYNAAIVTVNHHGFVIGPHPILRVNVCRLCVLKRFLNFTVDASLIYARL